MRLRFLILAIAISNTAVAATADDKDLLRDACVALKDKVKRSQCFDAIERISQSAVPAPIEQKAPPEPKKEMPIFINTRAFSCEPFEFSELNSLSEDQALGLYCGYYQQHNNEVANGKAASSESDPGRKLALLQSVTRKMRLCTNTIEKMMDFMKRKFPNNSLDCTKVVGYTANKE